MLKLKHPHHQLHGSSLCVLHWWGGRWGGWELANYQQWYMLPEGSTEGYSLRRWRGVTRHHLEPGACELGPPMHGVHQVGWRKGTESQQDRGRALRPMQKVRENWRVWTGPFVEELGTSFILQSNRKLMKGYQLGRNLIRSPLQPGQVNQKVKKQWKQEDGDQKSR